MEYINRAERIISINKLLHGPDQYDLTNNRIEFFLTLSSNSELITISLQLWKIVHLIQIVTKAQDMPLLGTTAHFWYSVDIL